jgi:hypothetical protein
MDVRLNLIRLIELSEDKIMSLKAILDFTKKVDLTGDDDLYSEAQNIVEARQEEIIKMMDIDNEYLKVFEETKTYLGIDDITDIDKIEYPKIVDLYEKTYEIMSLLEEIKSLDEKNIKSINKKNSDMNEKINVNRNVNKINKSYGNKFAGINSYSFDKKK